MGHYDTLLGEFPTETSEGWKRGAIGTRTLKALIEGNLWHEVSTKNTETISDVSMGFRGTDLASPSQNQTLIDMAVAIVADLTVVSNSALQSAIDNFLDTSATNPNPISFNDFASQTGAPTGAFSKYDSGDDSVIRKKNFGIKAEDILAYNLVHSSVYTAIKSAMTQVDTGEGSSWTDPNGGLYETSWFQYVTQPLEDMADEMYFGSSDQAEAELQSQILEGEEAAKAAANKDEEELVSDVKLHMQEILASHLVTLAKLNKDIRCSRIPRYKKTYMLDGDPTLLINKLTYIPGSESFNKIKVAEASALVPKIRLSKIFYDAKGAEQRVVPITFRTYFDENDLFSEHSPGRNEVGIKSFDWALNGTNEVEAVSDVTATLVLSFQNFNALFRENSGGFKYADLLIRTDPQTEESKEVKIDAREAEEQSTEDLETRYNHRYYQIKVDLGWALNSSVSELQLTPDIARGIETQNVTMFLTLREHQFSINRDGSFSLSIEYQGAIDGLMGSKAADIIQNSFIKNELCRLDKESKTAKDACQQSRVAEIEEEVAKLKERSRFDSHMKIVSALLDDSRLYYVSVTKSDFEAANNKISNLTASDLQIGNFNPLNADHSDIMQKALDQSLEDHGELDPRWLNCESTGDRIRSWVGYQHANWFPDTDPNGDYTTWDLDEQRQDNMVADDCYTSTYNRKVDPSTSSAYTDYQTVEYDNGELGSVYNIEQDDGALIIPYFFFGDLVDLVADMVFGKNNQTPDESECAGSFHPNRIQNLKLILGTVAVQNLDSKNPQNVSWENINLGDIAIALPYFREWWSEKVVKLEKDTLPFDVFMKDCMKDFVLEAMGDKLFGGRRPQETAIESKIINLPSYGGTDPILNKIIQSNQPAMNTALGSRLDMTNINQFNPLRPVNPPMNSPQDAYFYKVYYITDILGGLTNDPEEDVKKGIHHFVLGASDGILKDASFTRQDVPAGMREHRVTEASEVNPFHHFADVYSVRLTFFGNIMFYPGQILYLNPIGLGSMLGSPAEKTSPAFAMGLGGYHTITQVSHFIESGKFETTVEALWTSPGGTFASKDKKGNATQAVACSAKSQNSSTALNSAANNAQTSLGNIQNKPQGN